jgi:DNA-binding HxlR family transcriptional regulator
MPLSETWPRVQLRSRRRKLTCNSQVTFANLRPLSTKRNAKRRSGCPVSISLDTFGDRWSLLIIRDMMIRGFRTFKEFEASGEGIASNVLADRLRRLAHAGLVAAEGAAADGRRVNYRLTKKGIDLAPVLLELLIWGARHGRAQMPCALIEKMENNRSAMIAEVRRRWEHNDPTPLQVNGRWVWP